jgi:hypothetical protein
VTPPSKLMTKLSSKLMTKLSSKLVARLLSKVDDESAVEN